MRNWRWYLGFLALAAVLIGIFAPLSNRRVGALATGASAQVRSSGDTYHGVISVEGKEVPLPPGEWLLAGRAVTASGEAATQHAVVSVALVRLHGMAVDEAVLVQTNRLDTDADWGKATACERSDFYFARVRYESDHDGSCAYAAYVTAAQTAYTGGTAVGDRLLLAWLSPNSTSNPGTYQGLVTIVPEPSSFAIAGLAGLGMLFYARRRWSR